MRIILFITLITMVLPLRIFALQLNDSIDYAGFLKMEIRLKNNTDNSHQHLSGLKNTFDIGFDYKLSENWSFFFHPRFFYDFAYDIREQEEFDRTQHYMGHTQRTEWLRDCYLDYNSDNLDIRLGKQQVAWGHMDIPILDKVMPFDLTNWFLPDLADMRIPLWMAKIDYSPKLNSTLQFLIIPDFEASRVAPPGAPFSFSAYNNFYNLTQSLPILVGTVPFNTYLNNIYVDTIFPSKQFENSTFGVRFSSMLGNLEYTLNWLYGFTTSSYLYEEDTVATFVPGAPPHIELSSYNSRRFKRVQMMGLSFAKSFVDPGLLEGITLKGEFAYIHDEPTYYGTSGSRELTEVSDKYNWGIAIEKDVVKNTTLSLQLIQFIVDKDKRVDPTTGTVYKVLDTSTYGVIDKVETSIALKLMTDFMYERVKPEITVIYQEDNQGRIVPKVGVELRDNLWLKIGYAHFYGRPDSSNGQFRNNDQLMMEVKYTF
ncbi:MAG: DUF1302 family protein [Candidatus Omnitrophica bacterium]|nr:DUF1302 family protein [Candidatus Omnitrophota bacterium]